MWMLGDFIALLLWFSYRKAQVMDWVFSLFPASAAWFKITGILFSYRCSCSNTPLPILLSNTATVPTLITLTANTVLALILLTTAAPTPVLLSLSLSLIFL